MPDTHFPTTQEITAPSIMAEGGKKRLMTELLIVDDASGASQNFSTPKKLSPIPINANCDVIGNAFTTPDIPPTNRCHPPTLNAKRELLHPNVTQGNVQLQLQLNAAGTDVKTPTRARRPDDPEVQTLRQQIEEIKAMINAKVHEAVEANTAQVQAAAKVYYQEEIQLSNT